VDDRALDGVCAWGGPVAVRLAHDKVLRAIELLGTEVAPAVRAEVARREAASAPA